MILGIDPGYATLGYAFLKSDGITGSRSGGIKPELVDLGIITTSPKENFVSRLLEIEANLTDLIVTHKPTIAGVEKIFFKTNTKTAIDVAQARGVVLVTLKRHNLKIEEYSPLQIKKSITLRGKATKKEVEWMVMKILGLEKKISQDDAADAVAIALTSWYQLNNSNLAGIS